MSALSAGGLAAAGGTSAAGGNSAADAELADDVEYDIEGAVMFCVRDVRTGEASILHGTEEVIVRDRQLVNRILRAANVRRAV